MKQTAIFLVALTVAVGGIHAETRPLSLGPEFVEEVNAGIAGTGEKFRLMEYSARIHTSKGGEISSVEGEFFVDCGTRKVSSYLVYTARHHELPLAEEQDLKRRGFRLASMSETREIGTNLKLQEQVDVTAGIFIPIIAPCMDASISQERQHLVLSLWISDAEWELVWSKMTEERFKVLAQ